MKTLLVVSLAALCASIGETFLSYGMRRIAQPHWSDLVQLAGWVFHVICSPYVLAGIAFLAAFFFLYAAALSWADLSFVLPLTAMSFVYAAILARVFLMEKVSWWRWIGTAVIIMGITLVSLDSKQQTTGGPEQAASQEMEDPGV